jgi:hypothetical protein
VTAPKNPKPAQRAPASDPPSPVAHRGECASARIEVFVAFDPGAAAVTVIRCLDCGAAAYERE